jgi:hypothetical protein
VIGAGPGAAGGVPPIDVRGGTAGTAAVLEDLLRAGAILRGAARQVGEQGRVVLAVLTDPGFLLSAPRSVRTFRIAEAALREAGVGAHGVLPAAARLDALGLAVTGAAAAYRAADAASEMVARGLPWAAGHLAGYVGGGLVRLAAPALPGFLAAPVAVRALPATAGPGPPRAETSGCARPVPMPIGAASRLAARHVGAVQVVAAAIPGALDGLVAAGLVSPSGPVRDVAAFAGSLGLLGVFTPWLHEDGRLRLSLAQRPVPARPPSGLADLASRIAALEASVPGANCAASPAIVARLRVDQVTGPGGGRAWVVEIPGIGDWSPRPGVTPLDLTAAVHSMAGRSTAAGRAVSAALHAAGARPGEPVLLAGHSEGGLLAAAIAADPSARAEFRITHVVAFGSPTSGFRRPHTVEVLAIEHTDDVVPRLDGAPDPDGRRWITVSRSASGDPPEPGAAGDPLVAAHGMHAYRRTAAAVDASAAPSIAAWRAGAAAFFARPGARGITTEFLAARSGA